MNAIRSFLLIAVVAVFGLQAQVVAAQSDQTLTITEADDAYRLSVPVSRLVMTIPKGSLTSGNTPRRGSATSPRYLGRHRL